MDEKQIKSLARMQKSFSKLYEESGELCGIGTNGVQVTEQELVYQCEYFQQTAEVINWHDTHPHTRGHGLPYIAWAYFYDVKFFTVGTEEEFVAVGLLK